MAVFGGLIASGFVAGMHPALVLGAAAVLLSAALTYAYVDRAHARGA